ncbi:hypothetical protein E2320_002181 [Naja naja]|nr:hypothetical protein E2320_002181 [Naja naja]
MPKTCLSADRSLADRFDGWASSRSGLLLLLLTVQETQNMPPSGSNLSAMVEGMVPEVSKVQPALEEEVPKPEALEEGLFDGNPDHIALFLSQAISHLDQYIQFYPSQWAMVVVVMVALESGAAEWVACTESTPGVGECRSFLEGTVSLVRGWDPCTTGGRELLLLKQRGQSAVEYVPDFHRVVGKLRAWPERLLVHQFRVGLDRELCQSCVYQGISHQLQNWFQAVIDLDAGLQEFRPKGDAGLGPRKPMERLTGLTGGAHPITSAPGPTERPVQSPLCCF